MTHSDPNWRRSVRIMRVACPLAGLAAAVLASVCWYRGLCFLMVVNAATVGVNIVLTDVQWRWFKL